MILTRHWLSFDYEEAHPCAMLKNYGIVDKSDLSGVVVISDFDDWYDSYAQQKMQEVDPVVHIALHRNTDFFWNNEKLIKAGYTLPEFYTAAAHAITSGRTFVLHDYAGHVAMLTIMSVCESPGLDAHLIIDRAELQMLLTETHTMFLSMYAALYRREHISESKVLSVREREILYLISVGNEYPEVAKETTVRFHLNSVNKKLGAKNTRHAIRIAMKFNMTESF